MGKYGYFDDNAREYIVKKHFPPVPWMNFLTNEDFTAIISNNAGGCAFYKESGSGRLTRYNQTRQIPMDRPGFYFYIREEDGSLWTPHYEPVRTPLEHFSCRHGLGYTVFEAGYKGIESNLTYFVPRDESVLLWKLTLTNHRSVPASLSTIAFSEFSMLKANREPLEWAWNRFYTSSTFDAEMNGIAYDYHIFEDLPKIKVFMSSSVPIVAYDCNRDAFIGRSGTLELPDAVKAGKLTNSNLPGGGYPMGGLQNTMTLLPGESRTVVITLGCDPGNFDDCKVIARKYRDIRTVDAELARVKAYWKDYTSVYQCDLPDKDMERMLNIWNPYNCSLGFNRKMSMTSQTTGMGSGGVQTRDSSQDSMSLVSLDTERAKKRMAHIMRYQLPSGEYHSSFDMVADVATPFYAVRSDNAFWPVFTLYGLIAETGEDEFLDRVIPYYGENTASVSVLEHLARGLMYVKSLSGKNGIPLIVEIDWNDNLYVFSEDGKEESVMNGQQLVYACRLLKEMAEHKGHLQIAEWCQATIDELTASLNSDGVWDGDWYKRYIYAGDRPALGSKASPEGKIFLNTQSWAVISGTAPNGRDIHCMDKAAEMLGTPYGLKLCYPAFTGIPTPQDPLWNNGPGIRENGGVFHHAHTWAIMAETVLGRGDIAHAYYRQTMPNAASTDRGEDLYLNEPYAYSSTSLADPDARAGEADMAWFSGTVTWMYLVGSQNILGIQPTMQGLKINPCIPSDWREYKVTRKYRGKTYEIMVYNPEGVQSGVRRIMVNGNPIDGNILPLNIEGDTVQVIAIM